MVSTGTYVAIFHGMFKWRNYKIEKSGFNYTVTTPNGTVWHELACNVKTAIKWIELDIAERRSRKPITR